MNLVIALIHCAVLLFVGNHSSGFGPPPAPYLGTILVELSTLMASDDALPQRSPNSTGDLGVIARDLHVGLIAICVGTADIRLWTLKLCSRTQPQS